MAIDKQQLYGEFQKSNERNAKLADDITRKALDLPRDDDVNITTTNNGSSAITTSLATVGMLATGGTGAIGIAALMGVLGGEPSLPPAPAQPQAIVQPVEAEFTIRHRNADGDIIDVPQWKPGAQE